MLPALRQFDMPVSLTCEVVGTLNDLHVRDVSVSCGDDAIRFGMSFALSHLLQPDSLEVACPSFMLTTREGGLSDLMYNLGLTDAHIAQMLDTLGNVAIEGSLSGRMPFIEGVMQLHSAAGDLQASMTARRNNDKQGFVLGGDVLTDGINLAQIMGSDSPWGMMAFDLHATCNLQSGAQPIGQLRGHIGRFDYNGYSYENVMLNAAYARHTVSGKAEIDDPNARVVVEGKARINGRNTMADVRVTCNDVALDELHLSNAYPGYRLSFGLDAVYTGNRLDNANGYICIDSLLLPMPTRVLFGTVFVLQHITIRFHSALSLSQIISMAK